MEHLNNCEIFLRYIFDNYQTTLNWTYNDLIKNVDFNRLSKSNNITWNLISQYIHLPWNYDFLSGNPNITIDIINSNPDKPWNFHIFSTNSNITLEIVENNQHINWDWLGLSQNINIHITDVLNNVNYPWNWKVLVETIEPKLINYIALTCDGDVMKFKENLDLLLNNCNINNLNNITSSKMSIGNTSNTTFPLEIGFINHSITSESEYLDNNGLPHNTINSNFSLRCEGSIICNNQIYILSDERYKSNIMELDETYCKNFILKNTPKSYNLNQNNTKHFGFIAQDLIKNGYSELVSTIPNNGGNTYSINYIEIIPILSKIISINEINIEKLFNENAKLKQIIELQNNKIEELIVRINNINFN